MAYTLDFSIALGGGNTGLTLTAVLVDTGGSTVSTISTGFTEIGAGNYLWHATAIPDGHRGGVIFKSGATIKAFTAINPEEGENLDAKISSITGGLTAAQIWAYATRTLTQSAAQEWAEHGITVNAYCPGIVDTHMWVEVDRDLGAINKVGEGESMKAMAAGITLGRVSTGEDVAAFVSYLAGPDSNYMTGQSVLIDGGMLFT